MKILHTADWHLGAMFGQEKRTREFELTLAWLAKTIREKKIEAVLIAGDVFDTGMPPNSAVEQYYNFLLKARDAGVRKIVVVAGNHDSASFLDAPKELLKVLDIVVAGKPDPAYDSQIILLTEADGTPAAVLCAVPFLRDRDIRQMVSGETVDDQISRRNLGILEYYTGICGRAKELYPDLPLIVSGHFYAVGGKAGAGTTVGNLTDVPTDHLPKEIDYLALGHLHTPQEVGERPNQRYSGSLLKMSFGEHETGKIALVLDTADLSAPAEELKIPVFQRIEKISGTVEELCRQIDAFKQEGASVWLHAENTGDFQPKLVELLTERCRGSEIRIITWNNTKPNPAVQQRRLETGKPLNKLTPEEVFENLLSKQPLAEDEKESWRAAFREAVTELNETDINE